MDPAIGVRMWGSSPRMRGARRLRRLICMANGIIPADAGSTAPVSMTGRRTRDHPRGCGEHSRAIESKSE